MPIQKAQNFRIPCQPLMGSGNNRPFYSRGAGSTPLDISDLAKRHNVTPAYLKSFSGATPKELDVLLTSVHQASGQGRELAFCNLPRVFNAFIEAGAESEETIKLLILISQVAEANTGWTYIAMSVAVRDYKGLGVPLEEIFSSYRRAAEQPTSQ